MTTVMASRRRVALRMLLLEAGLLAAILGGFAAISVWRVGYAPLETLVLLAAALMAAALLAEWFLVRAHWKRLGSDLGGGRQAP